MSNQSDIDKVKSRVLLIAPVGEGVGGMICQTNALVSELNKQKMVTLRVIDSTQRYHDYHDNTFLSRAWGGSWQAVSRVMELLVSLLIFRPGSVQIRSSASLGLTRDIILTGLSRLMGAKTFVSFHFGRIPQLAIQRNWEWHLLGWVVRIANGVQVLDFHSASVLQKNLPNCNIRQFANSIDFDWIDDIRRRVKNRKSGRPKLKVIFVGMLLPTKGVVELVEACSRIIDADFELEMVGPVGPEMREQLCVLASQRDEGMWLKFSGALTRDEVVERVAVADIFVLPSYTEGFPGSVLEAMACSVAIVATSVGAIPEMLTGNYCEALGLIVPPRDTESLKLALEDLLKNPAKRVELGAAARRKCETNYRLSDNAHLWVKLWTGHAPLNKQR